MLTIILIVLKIELIFINYIDFKKIPKREPFKAEYA